MKRTPPEKKRPLQGAGGRFLDQPVRDLVAPLVPVVHGSRRARAQAAAEAATRLPLGFQQGPQPRNHVPVVVGVSARRRAMTRASSGPTSSSCCSRYGTCPGSTGSRARLACSFALGEEAIRDEGPQLRVGPAAAGVQFLDDLLHALRCPPSRATRRGGRLSRDPGTLRRRTQPNKVATRTRTAAWSRCLRVAARSMPRAGVASGSWDRVHRRMFNHSHHPGSCRLSCLTPQTETRSARRSSIRPCRVSRCLRVSHCRSAGTR